MTLGEIIDMVYQLGSPLFGQTKSVNDKGQVIAGGTTLEEHWPEQALVRLANVAQDDLVADLGAPTEFITVTNVTDPNELLIPDDATEDGLVQIWRLTLDSANAVTKQTPIEKMTIIDAGEFEPDWSFRAAADQASFVIYDPAQSYKHPYPVPPPDSSNAQHFRMLYKFLPDAMNAMTDAPFNNRWKEHHMVIVYWMLAHIAPNSQWQQQLEVAKGRIRGHMYKGTTFIKPRFWNAFYNQRGMRRGNTRRNQDI